MSRDGKRKENMNYQREIMMLIDLIECIDENKNYVYFMASPIMPHSNFYTEQNWMAGKIRNVISGRNEGYTPITIFLPMQEFAIHSFSNHNTYPVSEWISLPDHKPLDEKESIAKMIRTDQNMVEYFTITTEDNITVDGWMIKPANFDSTKKYPVVFLCTRDHGKATVNDSYGSAAKFFI